MKYLTLLVLAIALFSCDTSKTEEQTSDIIKLPTTFHAGYGNFEIGFGFVNSDVPDTSSMWFKTRVPLTGIPSDWEDTYTDQIWFNSSQFAYQNYTQGNFDSAQFHRLVKGWNIDVDDPDLSEKPIKCFTHIVVNNGSPTKEFIIDSNGNRDFSDDEIHSPPSINWEELDSTIMSTAVYADYEYKKAGKIETQQVPLVIIKPEKEDYLLINTALYLTAEYQNQPINIDFGFYNLVFESCDLKLPNQTKESSPISTNQFVTIGDNLYKNLGIDSETRELTLQKMPKDTLLTSTQVGFQAIPFEENTFITEHKVSLDKYKGKYLYIEFWGTWCGPCMNELPNLIDAYASIDTSKAAFLGVALDDSSKLHATIKDKQITWDQVLKENEEDIIEDYSIEGYPTSFLIDPNGKIIAQELRGSNLADTLNYFIN